MNFLRKTNHELPSVTVIVLSHNQEGTISETLNGIMMQNLSSPIKIVVHNDFSSDGTLFEIYKALGDSPFPYSVISPTVNQYQFGMGFFYNLMAEVTTKYVAICDGDDLWTVENKLQKQIDMMEQNPKMPICHHRFKVVDRKSRNLLYEWPPEEFRKNLLPGTELSRENFIGTLTVVFRRKNLPTLVPGYSKLGTGDFGLWGLIAQDSPIGFIDECMAEYRLHENQVYANREASEKNLIINRSRLFVSENTTGEISKIWKDSID
jgi:glycosyltransferase involved in cell wall biosynthesis